MLIKSKGHRKKSGIFRFLVNYIWSDKGRANEENSFSFFHNLSTFEPEQIAREFEQNDAFRKQRSNGLAAHHIIMSFSPEDSEYVTHEALHDLVTKFVQLRGEDGLYFARIHPAEDHIHVHILMFANKYRLGDSMRMSKAEFNDLQMEIEAFQIENYPEISHSLVMGDRDIELPDLDIDR